MGLAHLWRQVTSVWIHPNPSAFASFAKMVATAEYAASGFDVFGALLARHAVATFGYCFLAFIISYFFLKSREIAA